MYQFLDPIFGLLIFITLIMFTILTMVLAQSLPDKPTRFTQWVYNKLNNYEPSVIFWNGVYWSLFIPIWLVWPEIGIAISGFGSILYLGAALDKDDLDNQTWPLSTFIFWLFLIIAGIGFGLYWIYTKTILKFNNFLNQKHNAQ